MPIWKQEISAKLGDESSAKFDSSSCSHLQPENGRSLSSRIGTRAEGNLESRESDQDPWY